MLFKKSLLPELCRRPVDTSVAQTTVRIFAKLHLPDTSRVQNEFMG